MLRRNEVVIHNGTKRTGLDPINFAKFLQDSGAGEIVVNAVDLDGTMQGYDLDLVQQLCDGLHSITVLGGAGRLSDWQIYGSLMDYLDGGR